MPVMAWRTRALVGAAIVAVVIGAPRLSAWGAVGHHVVARIAWGLLTPAARAQATMLLGGGQDAFVAAATWADDVRSARPETYNWHFVDIPYGETRYDAARDCPPTERGDCVIAEIGRASADLADAGKTAVQRAEALKYLIHFVGSCTSRCTASTTRIGAATTSGFWRCGTMGATRICTPPGIPG
jgi:hypothetical protein